MSEQLDKTEKNSKVEETKKKAAICEDLVYFFKEHPRVALGFSGGVDSAYLLYAGVKSGAKICPYYVKTPFQPAFEYEDALRLAKELQVDMKVIELPTLPPAIRQNTANRCYVCKQRIFQAIKEQALKDGYSVLIDGTNASDDAGDRPGMRALQELSVYSPLRLCRLSKAEVRRYSKEAGLFTWDKPAYACLATRIPTGEAITEDALYAIEQAEAYLMQLGFFDFRVRVQKKRAKLQVREAQLVLVLEKREEIIQQLKQWFDEVVLDLQVR